MGGSPESARFEKEAKYMRRTTLLTSGLCALFLVAGAAGVAQAVQWQHPATASWTPPQMASVPAPGAATNGQEAPLTVGTVETVAQQVLGALGGKRTQTLRYPGVDYVKVHFDPSGAAPDGKVTVEDPTGQESQTYTASDLQRAGDWAMSISGDTAIVTGDNGFKVDKVARGMTADERAAADRKADEQESAQREESICGRVDSGENAACYKSSDPVAYAHSKPVARLLINGVELCSAWRVGPNNRMFTNHHCIASSADASDTEVWFNYECARCDGGPTLRPAKVWGDRVLATNTTLDYTLFTVQNFNAISRFGYLVLDVRQPARGEELYIPQHPRGDPTVIAAEDPQERSGNCEVADPSYDGYASNTDVSYYCDTDGGSSGSPVISRQTNEVIALHHFGGCPNSGVRIDLIYRQVKGLL
jgi:trypsin-like peptidase